ncbi:hypothetical protein HYH02_001683 [Chlamydomonas schloesseri]|uniref:RanBP2-type domain-containing protein n=1 Tax=Chlamydomonas schloesseri TaxID=2026947 RepID=A0A835WT33_9CHLO|nr:hypothetical protein HYH02_001683 [Chlamydomonas schloesseri]|eukprot:KAG2453462.1 hypothetical protein HYH02_001683 [Chlamydomonas schloesseri]
MGDYTARLAPEDFDKLKARAERRELHYLPEVDGYFDDEKHYQEIRGLCGFTHPAAESGGRAPKFSNYNALKKHLENSGQFFCDVCVKGRKVFVSEQLVYNKETLKRHLENGDESGPLAESGFKGHPLCKFCRQRFYDSNELYKHMESAHEHCFLCRRAAPHQYVYFRHYKELEDHFTKAHHPCPHPHCLERKFVVFDTEYELKAHFAAEHGDEVKMSAAQRRQAMTIPLNLQYRSHDDEETEPGPSARLERAAVVIGGGYNLGSRAARPGRVAGSAAGGAAGLHHSRSEPQLQQQDQGPDLESVTFTAEDFPAPSSAAGAGAAGGALGRWAAFAGAQGSANVHDEEHFPALPSLSKNQRRRIKEQQRSLADRLSAAAQPARVLHRATPGGAGGGGSDAAPQLVPGMSDFPALRSAGPAAPAAPPAARPVSAAPAASSSASASGAGPSTSSAASSSMAGFTPVSRTADVVAPLAVNRKPPSLGQEDFPSLGGKGKGRGAAQTPALPPPATSAYAGVASGSQPASIPTGLSKTDVLQSLFMRPGSAAATLGGGAGPSTSSSAAAVAVEESAAAPLAIEDFPSLPPGSKAKGRAKVQLRASPAKPQQSQPAAPAAAAAPAPAAAGGGGGAGGVSDSLKAANKALVERVKQRLTGDAFNTFRQQSLLFMRGELSAEEYHDYMVSLGLLSLTAELVSLLPDASKRRLLLDVHRAFIVSPAAQDPSLVGAGWMPPEAAIAKAARVAQHAAWSCGRCNLINAPDDARCESCSGPRPTEEQQLAAASAVAAAATPPPAFGSAVRAAAAAASSNSSTAGFTIVPSRSAAAAAAPAPPQAPPALDDFPSLPMGRPARTAPPPPSAAAEFISGPDSEDPFSAAGGGGGGKGKKGKGTTIKIGLGAGTGGAGRTHPQNQWTQPGTKAKVTNSWAAGGGKLAKMHGAINDAWGE